MTTQMPPSGWYSDPERPGRQRWWDGAVWTDHRRPEPTADAPLPASPSAPPGSSGPAAPGYAAPSVTGSRQLDRMLLPGETVIVAAPVDRGVAYLPAMVVAAIALGLFVILAGGGEAGSGLGFAVSLSILVGGPAALGGYLRLKTNYFALTDRRAVVTTGILLKTTREILVERIEGIAVTQTLADRFFKSGSLVVSGVGVGNVTIAGVERAFDVRMRVASWLETRR